MRHSECSEESLIINKIDFSLLLKMTLAQRFFKKNQKNKFTASRFEPVTPDNESGY